MSIKKLNDPVFIKGVVKRLAKTMGCPAYQRHVAGQLGLSEQDFANRKKRGTLAGPIVSWCLEHKKSLDYVLGLTADEQPIPLPQVPAGIRRAHRPLDLTPPSQNVADLVGMAWSVLESETTTADVLRLNIMEFYDKLYGDREAGRNVNEGGNRSPAPKKRTAGGGA